MSEKNPNFPKHIAIIPDGNRRWAKKKNLHPWMGHRAGVKAFEKVLEKSRELGIPYITFWGGSWDNLIKRPKKEVDFLFKIYGHQFKRILKDKRIHKNEVKVDALGKWQQLLPESAQETIKEAKEATKNYNKFFLTFLLAYDGVEEMADCVKKIKKLPEQKKSKPAKELIEENLWTKNLPSVDLVIRTGCDNDPHLSAGFMMWKTAYSQLFFTPTFLPDFSPKEFQNIVEDFSKRERRFGN